MVLFNDLIHPQQQRGRDDETEGLGRLQVDDEIEPRRLCRLRTANSATR